MEAPGEECDDQPSLPPNKALCLQSARKDVEIGGRQVERLPGHSAPPPRQYLQGGLCNALTCPLISEGLSPSRLQFPSWGSVYTSGALFQQGVSGAARRAWPGLWLSCPNPSQRRGSDPCGGVGRGLRVLRLHAHPPPVPDFGLGGKRVWESW